MNNKLIIIYILITMIGCNKMTAKVELYTDYKYDDNGRVIIPTEDQLKDFQSNLVVYHDDAGDYSTNEPTMDGTASLIYYLSSLESSEQ